MFLKKRAYTLVAASVLFCFTPVFAVEITWRLTYSKCQFLLRHISRAYSYRLASATIQNHQYLVLDDVIVHDVSSVSRSNSERKRIDIISWDHTKERGEKFPQVATTLQNDELPKFLIRPVSQTNVQLEYYTFGGRSQRAIAIPENDDWSDASDSLYEAKTAPTFTGTFTEGDWQAFLDGQTIRIRIDAESVQELLGTIVFPTNAEILATIWQRYFNKPLALSDLSDFDFHTGSNRHAWILYGNKYELKLKQWGSFTIEMLGER